MQFTVFVRRQAFADDFSGFGLQAEFRTSQDAFRIVLVDFRQHHAAGRQFIGRSRDQRLHLTFCDCEKDRRLV